MTTPPDHPKIYHITHLRNLPQILETGVLWSDAKRIEMGLECDVVGMSHIKQRRLREIEVTCHPDTHVGDYVPFYFCPKSIMLYILHKGNHPDLDYTEGQRPIIHLQGDLRAVVAWADRNRRRWAFSDRNAGTFYVNFFDDLDQLDQVNWSAVRAADFRNLMIKEGKQAEFLVEESFPWTLVERIGVIDAQMQGQVAQAIAETDHRPEVVVKNNWYY